MSEMLDNSLSENLGKINAHLDSLYLLANPFFRISKPTPENLVKYKNLKRKGLKFRIATNLVRLPGTVFLQSIWNISLSFITFREWFPRRSFKGDKFNFLGISQVTSSKQGFKEDPLLGQIPQILNTRTTLGMFYLNGTMIPRDFANKSIVSQVNCDVVLNSKTLSPCETIRVLWTNLVNCVGFIAHEFMRKTWTLDQLYLISEGVLFQFRRPTYANLVLLRRMIEILDRSEVQTIFFTIEGHSHEAMLISLIKTRYPEINIQVIQHAPLVPSQFGYFENLKLLRKSDSILCTGEITKDFTKEYLLTRDLACKDVRVIGSSKNHAPRESVLQLNQRPRISILLLPEGTVNSALEFLELLKNLAFKFPHICFVLRLHPATRENPKIQSLMNSSFTGNATISKTSLVGDLSKTDYCIYRSSAAALEALSFGVIPIHYNSNSSFDLDPIFEDLLRHPKATSYENLEEKIRLMTETQGKSTWEAKKMSDYFSNYYAPLNINSM